MGTRLVLAAVSCFLATGAFAASDVIISEFMASNTRSLADESGLYPDWIELHNTTVTNVNLGGWYLTDDSGKPTKWRIPSTNLLAGAYMVIFADGKDKAVPGAPLHTSFSLGAGGEFLALVRPDLSVATQFSPIPQQPDVSYGFGKLTTNWTLLSTNSQVRIRIPSSGSEGTNWTLRGYDDSGWIAGTNALGYGPTNVAQADYGAAVLPSQPVAFFRFSESSGTVATNIGSSGLNGTYSGVTFGSAGPRPSSFNGFEANNLAPTFNGSSSYITAGTALLSGRSTFTMGGWVYLTATPAVKTGLFGQNDAVEFGFNTATTIQCWTPGGSVTLSWVPPLNTWTHILVEADGANLRLFTNGVQAATGASVAGASSTYNFNIGGGGIWDATGNFITGLIDEVVVYHRALSTPEIAGLYQAGLTPSAPPLAALIKTDVGPVMSNINATAYLRIPFTIPDTNNLSQLSLRAWYNDGFVAYVNGIEVVRVNAADPLSYNSSATNSHVASSAASFSFGCGMLTNGSNVLAIQALNVRSNDVDFFISTELTATSAGVESSIPVYFTSPTPGAENVGGVVNPGPAIYDVTHAPNVPRDDQDIIVTAYIVPTFHPVSNVVVRYRVMFQTELELPMFDDGQHGDGGSNDSIFAATIPASSASTNGEMIRWFFRATDTFGNSSRWPLFANLTNSAEYLGTIVDPTNVTSKLPIIHFFAPTTIMGPGPTTPQVGADSQTGGRVSIFYDGEFYDNVDVNLRGNTTAGLNKKSHHLNFNPDHTFKGPGGHGRLQHTSFVADYPDPTYMRQGLSFWLTAQMGVPSPFYDPVRLQLNTQFYQLANHNNVVGAEQLEWLGFDSAGALYKAGGMAVPSQASTGNFEKKTRLFENNADYWTMTGGISETNAVGARKTNAFDMLDIPEMLNYLVSARFVHENDDVWANMTFYRDTLGDGLWRIIPFDMNLSWGAIYYEGTSNCTIYVEGVQATNDLHKAHPLYGSAPVLPCTSANYNRVYDAFFQVPELRQMYLRRMRTLLDTWVKPVGTPTNLLSLEQMILARRDLIAEEAVRDRAKWSWPAKGGQCNFNPGIDITNGVDQMLSQFVSLRRSHFYEKHSITNTALPIGVGNVYNAGIPLTQPANTFIQIGPFEYNPSSGNQGHEFIQLTNPNPYAVDISGWKLDGAVDFEFRPGTVMPSNSAICVTPDINAFRTRTTSPKTNQGLFVVGNYHGQLSARGEPILVRDSTGYMVASNSYPGTPSLPQQYLRITEIMYHPGPTNSGSPYGQEEFEYIELKNIGLVPISLVGVHFTNGIDFVFTATNAVTTLAAGQTVVLVRNSAAFTSRHGSGITIAGVFSGSLDNSGERIQLHDAMGEEILDFSYNNSWYPITDGLGFSLVIVNENAPFDTWDQKSSWRASGRLNGSPGTNEPAPTQLVAVVVNEVLANSPTPQVDAVEIWNPTTNTAPIGGWWLSDDFFTPKKFRIPTSTTITPGGFIVFDEHNFNTNPASATNFAFSSKGDEIYLFAADTAGNLLGYYHGFGFGASDEGVSFGRYVTSQGEEHFVAQQSVTLGSTNPGPRVGPVVISQIMYHPPDLAGADDQDNEFIELLNISGTNVPLYDVTYSTNAWKLKDAVDFKFASNSVLAAGQRLLVVSFDPATNVAVLAAFRGRYGLDTNVPIVGPYGGKLDNSGAHVELARPQPPETNGFDYVIQDKVDYIDSFPWSPAADGLGASLHRLVTGAYGNDPTNWTAAVPTPGASLPGGTPPVITSQPPTNIFVLVGANTNLAAAVSGSALKYQWRFNGSAIVGATNSTVALTNLQAAQSGDYQLIVFNDAGAAASLVAHLSVGKPLSIVIQPANTTNAPGSNATLSVLAAGNGQLVYQWRLNSNNIPGGTSTSLSFANLDLFVHAGFYDVLVTDSLGSVLSQPAVLCVTNKVIVTSSPVSVTVLEGQTARFSVSAGPIHPLLPLTYAWRGKIGGTVTIITNTPEWVFSNVYTNITLISVSVNNAGSQLPSYSPSARLTVLADSDRDGMADAWELANGFATNSAADALLDTDGDGMNNRDEYIAGTDPRNSDSVLRVTLVATNSTFLQFIAQTNVAYSLQLRSNLTTAAWQSWSNLGVTNIVRTIQFPAQTNDIRFYRVLIPPTGQ